MQDYYERFRDGMRQATAWFSDDDACLAHFHGSIEIAYVLEGSVRVAQNRSEWTAGPGDMIVNSCYVLHGYQTPVHSRVIVSIIPLEVAPSFRKLAAGHRFAANRFHDTGEFRTLLTMMVGLAEREEDEALNAIACAVLHMLSRRVGLTEIDEKDNAGVIREILGYIQNHYTDELSVQMLAKQFGYSESRFSHLFSERVGCSLPKYVNGLRCRRARALLQVDDASIVDIAFQAGFSSVRSFYRAYAREFGVAPSQDRIADGRAAR